MKNLQTVQTTEPTFHSLLLAQSLQGQRLREPQDMLDMELRVSVFGDFSGCRQY
jgi:hypothetical protein